MFTTDIANAKTAALQIEDQASRDLTQQILPVVEAAASALISGAAEALKAVLNGALDRLIRFRITISISEVAP